MSFRDELVVLNVRVLGQNYDGVFSLPAVEIAKLIRADLRQNYGNIKFSVQTRHFAHGCSVDVEWVDGPSEQVIYKLLDKFVGYDYNKNNDDATTSREPFVLEGKRISSPLTSLHCTRRDENGKRDRGFWVAPCGMPNKIFADIDGPGDPDSLETIELIAAHLIKSHVDKDYQSLFVRFNRLVRRMQDQQCHGGVVWKQYIKKLSEKNEKT